MLESQERAVTEFKQQHMGELPGQQEGNQRALDRLQLATTGDARGVGNRWQQKGLLMQQLSMLPPEVASYTPTGIQSHPLEQQLRQRQEALAELQGCSRRIIRMWSGCNRRLCNFRHR